MAKKKKQQEQDGTAEERIKAAARIVFHKKGFAATRTRDIAEEAGLNLALLNYYFRSKENLFQIIMLETMQNFVRSMSVVLMNEESSLEEKLEAVASRYIDLLTEEPEIPLFLLTELRNAPQALIGKLNFKEMILNSMLMRQYMQAVAEERIAALSPFHLIMNMIGLMVFPFVAKPILKDLGGMSEADFNEMMQERKKLVPMWMKSILSTNL